MVDPSGTDAKSAPIAGQQKEDEEQVVSICKSGGHAYILTNRRFMAVRLRSSQQHRLRGMDFIAGGFSAMYKIDANTEPSYDLVAQLAQDGQFNRIAEDFVTDQVLAHDARARVIIVEDTGTGAMSLAFTTEIPNLPGGPFSRELGQELLARLRLWTREPLQFLKPRWWEGGTSGWCFSSSDMETKRKSIDVSALWCRECAQCGRIRKTKEPRCPKCGGSSFY
jgi:hypothetical protein